MNENRTNTDLKFTVIATAVSLPAVSYQTYTQKVKKKKTFFNQTIQGRLQMFKVVLFFKLETLQTETMKGTTYLLPVGRLLPASRDVCTRLTSMCTGCDVKLVHTSQVAGRRLSTGSS